MALMTIGATALPEPNSYKVGKYDMDSPSTTRNERGVLFRDRVRAGVYKIEATWKAISDFQLKQIIGLTSQATFPLTFLSDDGVITRTVYSGDKSITMARYFIGTDIRWDLAFNMIEV